MGMKILKVMAALIAVIVIGGAGFFVWASSAAASRLDRTFEVHAVDFPVPFPLSEEEVEELRAERLSDAEDVEGDPLEGVDLAEVALERAKARGRHLVEARYVCFECHGENFAGGTMFDDPAVGQAYGPNLTGGKGSRVGTFSVADWDRIVRHGVKPDGRPAIMPSTDFLSMSDRELSDIIAYVSSLPPVDKEMPPNSFGPLLKVLIATNQVHISADHHPDHHAAHVAEPPLESDTLAFGKHLAQACTGCHRADFTGGPVVGGPPEWAPASDITAKGLASYTAEDFEQVLRTGRKPDGSEVKLPMTLAVPAGKKMKDNEIAAMYAYLRTLGAK